VNVTRGWPTVDSTSAWVSGLSAIRPSEVTGNGALGSAHRSGPYIHEGRSLLRRPRGPAGRALGTTDSRNVAISAAPKAGICLSSPGREPVRIAVASPSSASTKRHWPSVPNNA
jgi:hypothetical protein